MFFNFKAMVKKATKDFAIEAIKGLSKEDFDQLVEIFQKEYCAYSAVVNVDGTNDCGCDIKVFKGRREIKKCIQVTVQKMINRKLKEDLVKVSEMIDKYGYSNKFEFYCTQTVSEEKIEEYRKYAIDTYDIDLIIYEPKRLSQIPCKPVLDYIYSLHSDVVLRPEEITVDKTRKILYDLLANGKDTMSIKNGFVESVIISILYEKAPISISELKDELEKRLGKDLPDVTHLINILKTDHRVVKDSKSPDLLCLSEIEFDNFKDILAMSEQKESNFKENLSNILSGYGIEYTNGIFEDLVNLHKIGYSTDLDKTTDHEDDTGSRKAFEEFKNNLTKALRCKDKIDYLIKDIRNLCEENNYIINRISASESFLNLYKSNRLEQYLSGKQKHIYLDTPAFIYLLCSTYDLDENDWDNPFYRSMKNLRGFQRTDSDKVYFYISRNYISEVAGEIRKALQIAQLENFPFFKDLGGTQNTIFNYYSYVKTNNLSHEGDDFDCLSDFLESLGLEGLHVDLDKEDFFKKAIRQLKDFSEFVGIKIEDNLLDNENFFPAKTAYEKLLLSKNKNKSETAIKNDVNQVLLSLHSDKLDCYLATWDTTIYLLRDKLLEEDIKSKFHYFYIYNPSKLSNRIALENFNINEASLTNGVFAYADKRYDMSNRVKGLLELIAPFFKKTPENRLISMLAKLRREQIETRGFEVEKAEDDRTPPIEEVIITLMPSQEKVKNDEQIMEKFSSFMSSDENAEYIIGIVNTMISMTNFKEYDLSDFYKKIEGVEVVNIPVGKSICPPPQCEK